MVATGYIAKLAIKERDGLKVNVYKDGKFVMLSSFVTLHLSTSMVDPPSYKIELKLPGYETEVWEQIVYPNKEYSWTTRMRPDGEVVEPEFEPKVYCLELNCRMASTQIRNIIDKIGTLMNETFSKNIGYHFDGVIVENNTVKIYFEKLYSITVGALAIIIISALLLLGVFVISWKIINLKTAQVEAEKLRTAQELLAEGATVEDVTNWFEQVENGNGNGIDLGSLTQLIPIAIVAMVVMSALKK